jgi:hypothetical protein
MRTRRSLFLSLITITLTTGIAGADDPPREFTAQATMNTPQGTRHMPVTLIAARFTSVEGAKRYEELLAEGGQGALLNAIRGRSDGRLRLGALELPVGLVVAEPMRRGYRYVFVTARRIEVEESNESRDSLDYPFGVAVFEVDGFGRGDGLVYPRAAISVDPTDQSIEIEEYDGEPGTLREIRKAR